MKIHKVILNNVKSFKGKCEFDFENSSSINTVSGINGSGKSTLFKSIVLAQRIFFYEQNEIDDKVISKAVSIDVNNFFTSKNSEIIVFFSNNENLNYYAHFSITAATPKERGVFKNWKLNCEENDRLEIEKFWNIENPQKIIVYVDSNRYINEGDFTHEGVSLKTSLKGDDLALDYIFYPDRLFSSIYERIIRDYLRERVIPNKPRKDLPHVVSKIIIHNLLKYIQINNFTGLLKENQFVLQVKANKDRKKANNLYDLRNMSSGEKTIFYIIHFICYVNNIGMLIIDEPENNLHENLLTDFVNLLNDVCEYKKFEELVERISQNNGEKISDGVKKQISTFYKNHELSQVYLLTHSKNLIYNNFPIGNNYIIDNKFKQLKYDETEQTLRLIGLSKIQNKVLFVEGKTDNKLLEGILSKFNIKVRAIGNCQEVINTYVKYISLKQDIRDVQHCFMIDKDTRSESEMEAIRTKDKISYENHFIVLDRHEIENYLLESEIYSKLYKNHHSLFPELTAPKPAEIESKIKAIAIKYKSKVILKTIQNLNQRCFGNLKVSVSSSELSISSKENYFSQIDMAFNEKNLIKTVDSLKQNYFKAREYVKNWESDWKSLCDGKKVFREYVNTLVPEFGVSFSRLEKEIVAIAINDNSLAKGVIDSILLRFRDNE